MENNLISAIKPAVFLWRELVNSFEELAEIKRVCDTDGITDLAYGGIGLGKKVGSEGKTVIVEICYG